MLSELMFQKFIREVKSNKDLPVVVEGKRDKEVLLKFGFKNIITISGNSLKKVADYIMKNFDSAIILTDFDEEGKKKFQFLKKYLESYHIKINLSLSRLIKSTFKISKIEELSHFTKFMEADFDGQVSTVNDKIFNRSRIYRRRHCGKT